MEHLVNDCRGMQRQRIKKLGIKANSLFHCQRDSVETYDIELEDRGPKTFHKVLDGLGSHHPDAEKTSDTLLPPD